MVSGDDTPSSTGSGNGPKASRNARSGGGPSDRAACPPSSISTRPCRSTTELAEHGPRSIPTHGPTTDPEWWEWLKTKLHPDRWDMVRRAWGNEWDSDRRKALVRDLMKRLETR